MCGLLHVAGRVVGVGPVGFHELVLVALALLGISLIATPISAATSGGGRVFVWLLSQVASISVISGMLACPWSTAAALWGVSWAISIGALLIVSFILGAFVASAAPSAPNWQSEPHNLTPPWERHFRHWSDSSSPDHLRQLLERHGYDLGTDEPTRLTIGR